MGKISESDSWVLFKTSTIKGLYKHRRVNAIVYIYAEYINIWLLSRETGKTSFEIFDYSLTILFFFENSSAHSVQNVQQYILLKDLILRSLYVFE